MGELLDDDELEQMRREEMEAEEAERQRQASLYLVCAISSQRLVLLIEGS